MRKLKVVLCSALFSAATLSCVPTAWAEGEQSAAGTPEVQTPAVQTPESQNSLAQDPPATAPQVNPADPYDLQYFFADFKRFAIGDVVPDVYRSKKYEIVQWKVRHLPAPEADSHWTYMGGNYVLITNADGKILQAKQGEIYYKR
ncbi:RcnB family protein [Erwinia sp. Eh17-17]|jgi:Ni/Co efflux regulator RcnB|uniref:RcnB family protein n=1 Tax=Erwinia sp. Eh17-17 TaxID=3080330 RepID=UPI00320B43F9